MRQLEAAWQDDHRATRARLLALLYLLGGVLCLLVVIVRPHESARFGVLGGYAAFGTGVGVLILLTVHRIPPWLLTVAVAVYSPALGLLAAVSVTAVGVLALAPAVIAVAMYNGYFAGRPTTLWRQGAWGIGCYLVGAVVSGTSPLLMGLIPTVLVAVSVMVVLHRLTERLRRAASTDALTGAVNRSWLVKIAVRELGRRTGQPVSVLLIDLDNFKAVNDEHGHLIGDSLLTSVADAWRVALGDDGFLGRYGGDEFLVLLPRTTKAEALQVVQRLRDAHPARWTVGTATSDPGEALPVLLARADSDLLTAKRRRAVS